MHLSEVSGKLSLTRDKAVFVELQPRSIECSSVIEAERGRYPYEWSDAKHLFPNNALGFEQAITRSVKEVAKLQIINILHFRFIIEPGLNGAADALTFQAPLPGAGLSDISSPMD
jgi:hypothetical protein